MRLKLKTLSHIRNVNKVLFLQFQSEGRTLLCWESGFLRRTDWLFSVKKQARNTPNGPAPIQSPYETDAWIRSNIAASGHSRKSEELSESSFSLSRIPEVLSKHVYYIRYYTPHRKPGSGPCFYLWGQGNKLASFVVIHMTRTQT